MPPYSGLETTLIALMTAIVSCIGLFIAMGKVFMTRRECSLQHQTIKSNDGDTAKKIQELIDIQQIQFQMLRSIVLYMDIPRAEKQEILNKAGGRNGG